MTGPRIGSLFSGYGGLELGVTTILGGEPVWFSDVCKHNDDGTVGHYEPHRAPCAILAHHWPDVPNHGDITKIDWQMVEPVDVLTLGFPCQDVSHAGKRLGLKPGTRSGLWAHGAYAIAQLRPRLVVAENVRGLLNAPAGGDLEPCPWCVGDGERGALRALGAVLGDLADLGYDAEWHGVRASDAGAPHGRFRVFVFAWPATDASPADTGSLRSEPRRVTAPGQEEGGRARSQLAGRDGAPTSDTDGVGRDGVAELDAHTTTRLNGEHRGHPDGRRDGGSGRTGEGTAWGDYEPAIRRWEALTRPAPPPTEPGRNGAARLSPAFVEWMMGLPAGHVTRVPGLSRNDQLKALGNGVVPQQAALATRLWAATHTREGAA